MLDKAEWGVELATANTDFTDKIQNIDTLPVEVIKQQQKLLEKNVMK